jgi:ribosomal protein L7/L12
MLAECPVCGDRVAYQFTDDGFCATCNSCGAHVRLTNFEEARISDIFITAANDDKILAIKKFRELTGCGLKFSKIFIEKIMDLQAVVKGNPDKDW